MRISDWSSDVCSSDLGLLNEAASTGDAERLAALEQRFIISVSEVLTLQDKLKRAGGFDEVSPPLDALVATGIGDESLFKARQAELEILKRDRKSTRLNSSH